MSKQPVSREAIMKAVKAQIAYWSEHPVPIDHAMFQLECRISKYELEHGIPSERLHEALDSGEIEETFEICCWLSDYDLLQRLKRPE